MRRALSLSVIAAATLVAGCVDKASYETAPITVQTAKGPVVCQLYTHGQVLWDEAISAPVGMSIELADKVCLAEGERIRTGG